jgi:hypothetical protein
MYTQRFYLLTPEVLGTMGETTTAHTLTDTADKMEESTRTFNTDYSIQYLQVHAT